jgi:hypothetical protein
VPLGAPAVVALSVVVAIRVGWVRYLIEHPWFSAGGDTASRISLQEVMGRPGFGVQEVMEHPGAVVFKCGRPQPLLVGASTLMVVRR